MTCGEFLVGFVAVADALRLRLSGSFIAALGEVGRRLARDSSGFAGNRPGLGREARRVVCEDLGLVDKAQRAMREGFCLAHKARRLACEAPRLAHEPFGLAAKGPGVACEGLGLARRRQSLAHAGVLRSRWGWRRSFQATGEAWAQLVESREGDVYSASFTNSASEPNLPSC